MTESLILLLSLMCVLAAPGVAVAQELAARTALDTSAVDQATLKKLLAEGQLLKVQEGPDGRMKLITGGIIVDKPVEDVYRVVTDFSHFSEFMPSVEECKVVADKGEVKDVSFKVKFKFVVSFSVEYVMRNRLSPPHEMTWTLVSSKGNKIKESFGSWKLIPLDGGKRTAAFYSIYSDLSDVIWGLERMLKKDPSMEIAINTSTVIMVLKNVKSRSETPGWVRKN
jgi:uncharacterized protein YndB with AHSA1/START domain